MKYPHHKAIPLHYLISKAILCSERGRYWVFPLQLQTGTYFYTWQTADAGSTFRQNTWSWETNRPFMQLSKLSRRISGSVHPRLQYHKAISKKKPPHHPTCTHVQKEQKSQDTVKYQQKGCSVCNFPYSWIAELSWGEQQKIQQYWGSGHQKLHSLRKKAKF